ELRAHDLNGVIAAGILVRDRLQLPDRGGIEVLDGGHGLSSWQSGYPLIYRRQGAGPATAKRNVPGRGRPREGRPEPGTATAAALSGRGLRGRSPGRSGPAPCGGGWPRPPHAAAGPAPAPGARTPRSGSGRPRWAPGKRSRAPAPRSAPAPRTRPP